MLIYGIVSYHIVSNYFCKMSKEGTRHARKPWVSDVTTVISPSSASVTIATPYSRYIVLAVIAVYEYLQKWSNLQCFMIMPITRWFWLQSLYIGRSSTRSTTNNKLRPLGAPPLCMGTWRSPLPKSAKYNNYCCVTQRQNVGLWPANFPCPALDL